ncbi:hypothetical protein P8452_56577 [Trifolium repens]|nr:hypothetical protein P8452_56577 [Trifolium repens]
MVGICTNIMDSSGVHGDRSGGVMLLFFLEKLKDVEGLIVTIELKENVGLLCCPAINYVVSAIHFLLLLLAPFTILEAPLRYVHSLTHSLSNQLKPYISFMTFVQLILFTTFVVEWSLMGIFSPPYGLIKLQLCKPKKEEDPKGNKWTRILKGTKKVKVSMLL